MTSELNKQINDLKQKLLVQKEKVNIVHSRVDKANYQFEMSSKAVEMLKQEKAEFKKKLNEAKTCYKGELRYLQYLEKEYAKVIADKNFLKNQRKSCQTSFCATDN